jgi:hypothetical protein
MSVQRTLDRWNSFLQALAIAGLLCGAYVAGSHNESLGRAIEALAKAWPSGSWPL